MNNEAIKMMIKMPLSILRAAILGLPLALTASCGGESTTQNNTVRISPSSLGVTSSPGTVAFITQTYRIESRSPTGNAQIGTDIMIHSAGTLYAGEPTLGTITCTGLPNPVCVDTALSPLILPYKGTTDSTGTVIVTMILGFVTGAEGTATVVEAFSGTGYGKTDVVFTCVDGTTACP